MKIIALFTTLLLTLPLYGIETKDRLILTDENLNSSTKLEQNLLTIKGKRLKFSYAFNYLAISLKEGEKHPNHAELIDQKSPVSAGYITITTKDTEPNKIQKILLENKSGRLCPDYISLWALAAKMETLIQDDSSIELKRLTSSKCLNKKSESEEQR
jgi:hypothetical protein